jgi:hypothetical protein
MNKMDVSTRIVLTIATAFGAGAAGYVAGYVNARFDVKPAPMEVDGAGRGFLVRDRISGFSVAATCNSDEPHRISDAYLNFLLVGDTKTEPVNVKFYPFPNVGNRWDLEK